MRSAVGSRWQHPGFPTGAGRRRVPGAVAARQRPVSPASCGRSRWRGGALAGGHAGRSRTGCLCFAVGTTGTPGRAAFHEVGLGACGRLQGGGPGAGGRCVLAAVTPRTAALPERVSVLRAVRRGGGACMRHCGCCGIRPGLVVAKARHPEAPRVTAKAVTLLEPKNMPPFGQYLVSHLATKSSSRFPGAMPQQPFSPDALARRRRAQGMSVHDLALAVGVSD